MKKHLAALALVLATPFGVFAADAATDKAAFVRHLEAGEKQTVVAIGTSLTEGGAWVGELKAVLDKKYPDKAVVLNLGRSASATSAPAGPRCGLEMVKEAVAAKPDTVFIEYAMNDCYLPYKISLSQSEKNLNAIIDRILAANPKAEVILQTMNSCKDFPEKNKEWMNATTRPKLAAYYQMFRDVAKKRRLRLVDHYPNWLKIMKEQPKLFDRYVPDRIHPNAEGCQQVVMPTLLKSVGL